MLAIATQVRQLAITFELVALIEIQRAYFVCLVVILHLCFPGYILIFIGKCWINFSDALAWPNELVPRRMLVRASFVCPTQTQPGGMLVLLLLPQIDYELFDLKK